MGLLLMGKTQLEAIAKKGYEELKKVLKLTLKQLKQIRLFNEKIYIQIVLQLFKLIHYIFSVVRFLREFIEQNLSMLNTSVDSVTGETSHYHIVIFKNLDGKMTMLLSKPVLREIDISQYVVGEI